jgi:ribose 5-phosphate isomerase B
MKTILLASDHAGFEMKQSLVEYVRGLGYRVEDLGPHEFNQGDNYPELIAPLARRISENPDLYSGIVVGGTGQGEAMVCNRFLAVRAAVYYGRDIEIVRLSRAHNDANILSLGARFIEIEHAKDAVSLWLSTSFEGGRHADRVQALDL